MTKSMDADSFILALHHFIARHGNFRSIWCDNGSNFIEAEKKLEICMNEMDNQRIWDLLLKKRADQIVWQKNPPMASHMGGAWERQIRSARIILSSLIRTHRVLMRSHWVTCLLEVETIVNSRPMVVETINNVTSEVAIALSLILTMKSKVVMPPPGVFCKPHLYCWRGWRRIQHISNESWSQWRKEFWVTFQKRDRKEMDRRREPQRNFSVAHIVILQDESHRNNGAWIPLECRYNYCTL